MNQRQQADAIIRAILEASKPEKTVQEAIANLPACAGKTILLAVGKAAFAMAAAALTTPGFIAHQAMVITKYGHVDSAALAALPPEMQASLTIREAGHPIPDANSYAATEEAIAMVQGLTAHDRVLLLLSGGGSALFEQPLLPPEEMVAINQQLLSCGVEIGGINTIRKRFSAVKGGRYAQLCAPAQVITIALSDVLSNASDQIASGPASPDPTTCGDALRIVEKFHLQLSSDAQGLLRQETPKQLPNATVHVIGGMTFARKAAAKACAKLGYPVWLFQPPLTCQAQEAGHFFGALARRAAGQGRKIAIVAGGETVVQLPKTHGLGGRNQEMALAAALEIQGLKRISFFSLGTDGTDGPTDAAGGYVDGNTVRLIDASETLTAAKALQTHDAYHALQKSGGLILTGPTGTNVNDVCVLLVSGGGQKNR